MNRHRATQLRAVKWLESRGFAASIEYPLALGDRRFRVDAYGTKGGYSAVIECGYSPKFRLEEISKVVDELYIMSLGDEIPVLWHPTMRICGGCGRLYTKVNDFDESELRKYYFSCGNNHNGENSDVPDWNYIQAMPNTPSYLSNERMVKICNLRREGFTYEQIGGEFGITRERVRQLLPKKLRGHLPGSSKSQLVRANQNCSQKRRVKSSTEIMQAKNYRELKEENRRAAERYRETAANSGS